MEEHDAKYILNSLCDSVRNQKIPITDELKNEIIRNINSRLFKIKMSIKKKCHKDFLTDKHPIQILFCGEEFMYKNVRNFISGILEEKKIKVSFSEYYWHNNKAEKITSFLYRNKIKYVYITAVIIIMIIVTTSIKEKMRRFAI